MPTADQQQLLQQLHWQLQLQQTGQEGIRWLRPLQAPWDLEHCSSQGLQHFAPGLTSCCQLVVGALRLWGVLQANPLLEKPQCLVTRALVLWVQSSAVQPVSPHRSLHFAHAWAGLSGCAHWGLHLRQLEGLILQDPIADALKVLVVSEKPGLHWKLSQKLGPDDQLQRHDCLHRLLGEACGHLDQKLPAVAAAAAALQLLQKAPWLHPYPWIHAHDKSDRGLPYLKQPPPCHACQSQQGAVLQDVALQSQGAPAVSGYPLVPQFQADCVQPDGRLFDSLLHLQRQAGSVYPLPLQADCNQLSGYPLARRRRQQPSRWACNPRRSCLQWVQGGPDRSPKTGWEV